MCETSVARSASTSGERTVRLELIAQVLGDSMHAVRTLRRNKLFTLVACLTITLGVGAGTAIFSVTDALLVRALPYLDPGDLVMLWNTYDTNGCGASMVTAASSRDV